MTTTFPAGFVIVSERFSLSDVLNNANYISEIAMREQRGVGRSGVDVWRAAAALDDEV